MNASLVVASDGVLARVESHSARFGAISRQIWQTPELGFHETKSSDLLQKELRANGFAIQANIAGMPTAFTASWGSGTPVIVLLGEFDALPGLSQKDVPVQEPVLAGAPGHGCGHNLLTHSQRYWRAACKRLAAMRTRLKNWEAPRAGETL